MHKNGGTKVCGSIDHESGIYLVEAMKYAINKINSDPSKLYNVRIGYRIVDTCRDFTSLRTDIPIMARTGRQLGVVGPATSDEAILASSAFGIYQELLTSYHATSVDLQDRQKYFNFYRTLPSDEKQSLAIRDTLRHFNWTYVSMVNSHGAYGQSGIEFVIKDIQKTGICIATRNMLPRNAKWSDYLKVIESLHKDPNARTVILFTSAVDTRNLLLAARTSQVSFTWVSSSAWAADLDTVRGVEETAKGAILINYAGIRSQEFHDYFQNLKYENDNQWMTDFWEDLFNCSFALVPNKNRCHGKEQISNSSFFGKYAVTQAVIDAVNVYAYAFRCTIAHLCTMDGAQKTVCARNLETVEVRGVMEHFIRFRPDKCKDVFGRVKFDENGTMNRDIAIVNYDGKTYNEIGLWKWDIASKTSSISFKDARITWAGNLPQPPESICSKPCKTGERKVVSKTKECCFACHACQRDEILVNNTCIKCHQFELPDEDKKTCSELARLEIKLTDYMGIIILIGSVIGFLLNSFVLYLFIRHKNSKIVKSSSRELSFFMLGGLYLCFISPCIFLLNPTVVRCGLRRFIFGLSLTACYTPLMLKTNRIYRIFRAARFSVSMPFLVSPTSQISICFGLLGLQLLLSITWVIGDPPVVTHKIVDEYKMVANLCGADIFTAIINLIPCFCMLAASTYFAFKSRKYPKNYNEASSIGVTMYLSCVLWAVFVPLVLFVQVQSANPFSTTFVISNFTNCIGLISLAGLFGPKAWRLLLTVRNESSQEMYSIYRKTKNGNNSLENCSDFSALETVAKDAKSAPKRIQSTKGTTRRKSC